MEEWISTPESSTIDRIIYDDDSMVMTVEFKTSGTYCYYDVPKHVFEGIRVAPSKGQFLAQQVKGSFRYAKA